MQHDPALIDRMTFRSPTSGERVGLSFIEPRSVEDLIRRRDMVKDAHIDRIVAMLDEIEAHHPPPIAGEG